MKKKNKSISNPQVSPLTSNSHQPNNLVRTDAHDILPPKGWKTPPETPSNLAQTDAHEIGEQRLLAEKMIDANDDMEGGQP